MNEFYIRNVLEAALLAAGKSLQLAELGQLFDETTRPKTDEVKAALDALAAEYSNRGVEVKETAAGFRIQVRREFSTEVSRLWPERPARYSRALLETLALIAYRQPITRAEIENVRGVAVNPNIVKTVIERNWVRVVGHRDVPGRPELLGTTREFLDYFGLRSLDELPPLADLKTMGDFNPQLEFPSGAAPSEPQSDGGEVAALPVAGLPVNEATEADGTVGEVATQGDDGAVAVDTHTEGDAGHRAASETGHADDSVQADGSTAHVAESDSVHAAGDVGHTTISDSVQADGNTAHAAVSAVDGDNPSPEGEAGEQTSGTSAANAVARQNTEGSEAEASEAEAERTLAASDVAQAESDAARAGRDVAQHTGELDDSEASESADEANDPLDVLDDPAEDDADEDELSADGHGSRELVAAPRDLDN